MSIKILVDSASDISQQEANKKGIVLMPVTITFGETEYQDGVNLTPREFYEKLIESDILPKTSQINTYTWEQAYEKYTKNGDELIVITISSKLSGTYNNAINACENYSNVYVVDSMNACIGERLLCDYALRLIDQGKSAKDIKDILDQVKNKINVMAMIGTLEYLKKGGRISATAAIAGKILAIKPVVGIIDGEVKMIGKAMGSKNGSNLLNKLVSEKGGIDFDMPYGVIWSGLDNTTLKKYVEDSSHLWKDHTDNVPAYILGGTIGTHIGPGAVGVAFFEK